MPSGKHRFCKTLEIVFKKTKVSTQPPIGKSCFHYDAHSN